MNQVLESPCTSLGVAEHLNLERSDQETRPRRLHARVYYAETKTTLTAHSAAGRWMYQVLKWMAIWSYGVPLALPLSIL
jgi:hypothetical protein